MKRFFVLINTLALVFAFAKSEAQEVLASNTESPVQFEEHPPSPPQGGKNGFAYPLAEVRYELQASINRVRDETSSSLMMNGEAGATKPERSVKKAFIFSAIVPGAGELYNRSYLSALAFLSVEIGAWALYSKYNKRGDEFTDVFELYANTHWNEQRYWDSLARDSGGKCAPSDRPCLKDYERDSFSHFLPDSKNQTYYENIGKYDQFNAGWDDSQSGDARQRDSANREAYTFMRLDANKQFQNAARATTVVLVNHLLSALHAAYTTHRHNQQIKSSVGMRMENYNDALVPTMSVSMAW
ncbi:MAG: hypothetical protein AAB354_14180 [candidate division KSB1 bacterium]